MIDERSQDEPAPDWLKIANDTFTASTSYVDSNWRKNWERNIALFQSRHPAGSKYNSVQYKHRSRLFRPKTKSVVRKNEAAAAAAFFANVDVVSIEPENDADLMQSASAEIMNELVNYRLEKTIPWFLLLQGAIQSAQIMGLVASYQYWKFSEKTTVKRDPVMDDTGQPLTDRDGNTYVQETPSTEVVEDKPCIELMPLENVRFDPGADWTDIVTSSPYLIRMVPMYVDGVRQMMKADASKTGQAKWKPYSDGEIRQAMVDYDTTRQQRENKRQDPLANNNAPLKEFEIVWVHENFVRLDGEEMVYWTLGTQHLLSDPIPLKQAYFHGERPVVIGLAVLEANKAVPDSLVSIGAELQKEANDTVNQRRDNVSLVLNKRYFVKRNAQVDIESLNRNVPGGVTMMNSTEDVIESNWQDVTSSAYQEQDRLNVDFDELTGNFSQGSVQTNRKLNETVGGMQLMAGGANQMTEYLLRTFVETWVEPVLRQLVKLEQKYETDTVVIGLAGQKAKLAQKYGLNQVTDELLNQELTVRVNVGMGATDPHTKMQKFVFALSTYAQTMQQVPDADPEAVRREVFGLAGYKDGSRFFKKEGPPPAVLQMQEQMQKMGAALQDLNQKYQKAQLQLVAKDGELQVSRFDAQTKRIVALKPDAVPPEDTDKRDLEGLKAVTEAHLKSAQIDLVQAQVLKTLAEAGAAASPELKEKGETAEDEPDPKAAMAALMDGHAKLTEGQTKLTDAVGKMADAIKAPRKKTPVKDNDGNTLHVIDEPMDT